MIKYYYKNKDLILQFSRFFIVGFTAFAVDITTLLFFREVLGITSTIFEIISVANLFSVLLAVTVSYTLNRFWSFKSTEEDVSSQATRFLIVFMFSYILNQTIFGILTNVIFLNIIIAKVVVTAMQMVWNFFLYKFYVYKK